MKQPLVVFPYFVFFILVIVSFGFNQPADKLSEQKNGFALVELFTSEGCSSCPPADQAVAAIAAQHHPGVYVLCFHVDYWDHLGWKDPYSNSKYTARQQNYAKAFRLNSIYTPQAIVNGGQEFVGSDASQLAKAVQSGLVASVGDEIAIDAKLENSKQLLIHYKTNASTNTHLNIALVQLHASTQVKAGENNGSTLNHINIVRDFSQVEGQSGQLIFSLPAGLNWTDCTIIAFTQDGRSMQVTGCSEHSIQ